MSLRVAPVIQHRIVDSGIKERGAACCAAMVLQIASKTFLPGGFFLKMRFDL